MPPFMAALHLIPSVGVEVKRKGLTEEQNNVKNHRRSEYSAELGHDLWITPDEDEDEHTTEQGCRRKRTHTEFNELLRHPVISHVLGLPADKFDDNSEHRNTENKGSE